MMDLRPPPGRRTTDAKGRLDVTYCVGMMLDQGLVFMSDTRTNAGVDNVSVFAKTRIWHQPGDRTLVMMSSGNLATTQAVLGHLDERTVTSDARDERLLAQPSMFMTAELVGKTLRDEIARRNSMSGPTAATRFSASLILGGQIAGSPPRLFLIYPEGNFIEATPDTPFFQIGETKYGRPIIVRAYRPDLSFMSAIKLLTVSFDSTLKANLSVGLPLDVTLMTRDTMEITSRRMPETDPYYKMISARWGESLTDALNALPDPDFGAEGFAIDPSSNGPAGPLAAGGPHLVDAGPAKGGPRVVALDDPKPVDPDGPAEPDKPKAADKVNPPQTAPQPAPDTPPEPEIDSAPVPATEDDSAPN